MSSPVKVIKDCPTEEQLAQHREEKRKLKKEADREIRLEARPTAPGPLSQEAINQRIIERRAALEAKISKPAAQRELMHQMYIQMLDGGADKIIKKLMSKAMNDEDKDQIAALKMCLDRILPASAFDKVKDNNTNKGVTINITGIGQNPINIDGETLDV